MTLHDIQSILDEKNLDSSLRDATPIASAIAFCELN